MLPIQSGFDVATAEGDTVLIPQRHFERLFDEEFGGGVLGIRAVCNDVVIYGSCAPQSDDDDVYMPDWMMNILREKTMTFDAELMVDVAAAGPVMPAHTIRVRRAEAEVEVNIHELLQEFLYDCKYIQPNTVFHIEGDVDVDVVVEAVMDEEGFEMEVGQLGAEVNLDIRDPVSTPPPPPTPPLPPSPPSPSPPPMVMELPSTEEVRNRRLAYFNRLAAVANVANGGGQEPGAGNR